MVKILISPVSGPITINIEITLSGSGGFKKERAHETGMEKWGLRGRIRGEVTTGELDQNTSYVSMIASIKEKDLKNIP